MKRKVFLLSIPVYIVAMVLVFRYHNTDAPETLDLKQLRAAAEAGRQFVAPKVVFRDVTRDSGLTFVHDTGSYGEILFPEVNGPGCGIFDFDNDGDQDLFLVNSGKWPHRVPDQAEPTVTHSLYRNDGRGRFTDVGAELGLRCRSYGLGVCFGDFDNDGFEDIYVVCAGPNVLFRNDQGRRFVDVTAEARVERPEWSSVATFLDYDRDGWLDLFVANYVVWSLEIERRVLSGADAETRAATERSARLAITSDEARQRIDGLMAEGRLRNTDAYSYAPNLYEGTYCHLHRNLGNGTFQEVSEEAGLFREERGGKPVTRSMGVAVGDYDGDLWPDIAVANDDGPDFLFRNLEGKAFRDIGFAVGIATGDSGNFLDSMGLQWVDFRNDGRLCLCVGHYATQKVALYLPKGEKHPLFLDIGPSQGLTEVPRPNTNWGQFFFDYDLDGRQDFFIASGHISPGRALYHDQPYEQEQCLFWNTGEAPAFCRVGPEQTGPDLQRKMVGRGAAYGDLDNDGDLDLLLMTNSGPAYLFRNELGADRRFLRLKLTGVKSNRSAIGATVRVRTGDTWQRRDVTGGASYASQSEMPVTFGLGTQDRAEEIEILWPSGLKQSLRNVPANQILEITEGKRPGATGVATRP